MSVGGLEPPQDTPHAPQTCASTIPPHRQTTYLIFKFSLRHLAEELRSPLKNLTFSQLFSAECHTDKQLIKFSIHGAEAYGSYPVSTESNTVAFFVSYGKNCFMPHRQITYLIFKLLSKAK